MLYLLNFRGNMIQDITEFFNANVDQAIISSLFVILYLFISLLTEENNSPEYIKGRSGCFSPAIIYKPLFIRQTAQLKKVFC
jgi:hypothetical protein